MARSASRPERDRSEGFSLLELAVVVGILAVLLAIALPRFLGPTRAAHDRAAQSSLRVALTAAKASMASPGTYLGLAPLTEPGVTATDTTAASTGPTDVVYQLTATAITLAARSTSGMCFYLQDDVAIGTRFASTATGACAVVLPDPGLAWGPAW